jgi:RNA polymerase sigma-70 factor (ECF subfamily)
MGIPVDYAALADEKLLDQIARSEAEALAQLYDRYSRLVFSLGLAVVGDRQTAEEITLDVFVRVWQKAGTYRAEQARVSTWLTHITRNHAIDVLRRRSARPERDSVDLEAVAHRPAAAGDGVAETDPAELAELSLRRQHVQAALARLPADQQQALALAYFRGYTQREIAEHLGQPLGTIKSRMRAALLRLRDLLRDEASPDQSTQAPAAYNRYNDR